MSHHFELQCRYRFEAAHQLPCVPATHPCYRMHGHSYEIEVTVIGEAGTETGWVIDFADVDSVAEPLCAQLDHRLLNDIEGLENPTSEVLACWLWDRLSDQLSCLAAVRVSETPRSACVYRGAR